MEKLTLNKLKERFPDSIIDASEFRGEVTLIIRKEDIVKVCRFLKQDFDLDYNFLSDLCGVDYLTRNPRFDIVYNLYSLNKNHRIRLKVEVNEGESIPSVTSVWSAANWHEREVYDMLGVEFVDHPDLRRILMPEDWEGHPLRKDFPLTKEEVAFTFNQDKPPKIIP